MEKGGNDERGDERSKEDVPTGLWHQLIIRRLTESYKHYIETRREVFLQKSLQKSLSGGRGNSWSGVKDDCTSSSEGHLISSNVKGDDSSITIDPYKEHGNLSDIPSTIHSKEQSSDPSKVPSPKSSQTVKQNKSHRSVENQGVPPRRKLISFSKCGKCFNQKTHLMAHLRSHTGEKPFSCSDCGKSFNRKSRLAIHSRIHTGEKPFSCSDCGKCFTSKSVLIIHEQIHTGEKPFSCSYCGKCFNQKSNLIKHERIHTGEKPFSCSDCGKCFNQKCHLVTHEKIHTGEKPFSC